MNLFSLSNSVQFNSWGNTNNIENYQQESGYHTWTFEWEATLCWDAFADFSWNVGDIVDPVTKATTYLKNNPVLEAYATVDGSFTFFFSEDWWVTVSGYVDPARASILDASYWTPVHNYPTWWTKGDSEPKGRCMGLKS